RFLSRLPPPGERPARRSQAPVRSRSDYLPAAQCGISTGPGRVRASAVDQTFSARDSFQYAKGWKTSTYWFGVLKNQRTPCIELAKIRGMLDQSTTGFEHSNPIDTWS